MSTSSGSPPPRKVVHVDMDAFYASVEQRDDPALRGRPVVVAWRGRRSVVCAASYEARTFGIHSAMPAARAERLCPDAVFVPPDFTRYREVSRQVREVFARYTDLIEPLSLDEAYLDVTVNKPGLATATKVAQAIRADIKTETNLNASAGVAPNKFLAKIASDWRKPNGLFVIQPHEVLDFLEPLPVRKLPGVGKATQAALEVLGITTVAELRARPREELVARFGKFGRRLYNLARGIDDNPVHARQERKSLSAETTFEDDRPLEALGEVADELARKVWNALDPRGREPQTVYLKLRTADFRNLTRSLTPPSPPASADELAAIAHTLLARIELPSATRYRLLGVGLANFRERPEDERQPELFDGTA
ncbi:MAG: DNA polymerase IV [Gammaproteobacteria bacterium]|nr:DNA polymerase IV [Gammaproteobacteria bacterium]MCP5199504.1 DNA polymerase IV [Gammaproteobacteria bacterium]